MYDSRPDTLEHIKSVAGKLTRVARDLLHRATVHDASKLEPPEKELFDEFTPKLKDVTYGSDEYKGYLEQLQVALDHHYASNRHHPEHFENGVSDMTLMDVMEMLMDWWAATERHADGDIYKSLEHNRERFNIDPQLASILKNTIDRMKGEQMDISKNPKASNWTDADGHPAGGTVEGLGISIQWQDGTISDNGHNGAQPEQIIWAAIKRLEFFQESPFACPENGLAIKHLEEALKALEQRTSKRTEQGVEGKHQAHNS
jgi:hypothetical protein